jgi:hypothetical protein
MYQYNNAYSLKACEVKSKDVALRHAGAKGEKRYRCYSLILALHKGEWSVSRPGCDLPAGKCFRFPLDRRLGGPQSWSGHRG